MMGAEGRWPPRRAVRALAAVAGAEEAQAPPAAAPPAAADVTAAEEEAAAADVACSIGGGGASKAPGDGAAAERRRLRRGGLLLAQKASNSALGLFRVAQRQRIVGRLLATVAALILLFSLLSASSSHARASELDVGGCFEPEGTSLGLERCAHAPKEVIVLSFGRGLGPLHDAADLVGACALERIKALALTAGAFRRVVLLDISQSAGMPRVLPRSALPASLQALNVTAAVPPGWSNADLLTLQKGKKRLGDPPRFVKWAAALPADVVYAWYLELDVLFTGPWSTLFDGVEKEKVTRGADLVSGLAQFPVSFFWPDCVLPDGTPCIAPLKAMSGSTSNHAKQFLWFASRFSIRILRDLAALESDTVAHGHFEVFPRGRCAQLAAEGGTSACSQAVVASHWLGMYRITKNRWKAPAAQTVENIASSLVVMKHRSLKRNTLHHPIKCTALSQSAGAWQLSLATSSTEQLVPALLDAARWKDNNTRETGLQLLEEAWKEAKGRAMDAGRNQSQYGRPTNLDITFQ